MRLTARAACLEAGCGWEEVGDVEAVDLAARKHTGEGKPRQTVKHPTALIAWPVSSA